jgi:hypothetical protein
MLMGAWLGRFSSNPALRLEGRSIFYGWIYPLVVLVLMALVPCLAGMSHGRRVAARPRLIRSSLWTAVAATLALLAARSLALLPIHNAFLSQMAYSDHSLALRLQPIALWPVVYWTATRWRGVLRRG